MQQEHSKNKTLLVQETNCISHKKMAWPATDNVVSFYTVDRNFLIFSRYCPCLLVALKQKVENYTNAYVWVWCVCVLHEPHFTESYLAEVCWSKK